MQSWDGLRLGLLALGYSKVVWIHLHCLKHGLFRVGIAGEQECYPCPMCEQACKVSVVAEGFTRQSLPFKPERIHAQLTAWERRALLAEERIAKPRRVPDIAHGHKLRRGIPEHQPACDARAEGTRRAKLGYAGSLKRQPHSHAQSLTNRQFYGWRALGQYQLG